MRVLRSPHAPQWRVPIWLNEATRVYFERLASVSKPEDAARYRALLSSDPKVSGPADDYMVEHEPQLRNVINDPAVDVSYTSRDARPGADSARLDREAFLAVEAMVKMVAELARTR